MQTGGRTRGEYNRLSRQNDDLNESLIRVGWLRARLRGLSLTGSLLIIIGYYSHDLPLMRGSIERNITYNDPDADLADVQRVCYALGIDTLLERHPHGLKSWLTEGGTNVSPGERQLIALARALVGNPVLLLLDQPYLGLDPQTADRVREVIGR